MRTFGAIAALLSALSLAGPSTSHAVESTMSGTDDTGPPPCNDVCKAYMAWSDRVSAKLHPSSPVAQAAVHDGKPAGQMVRRRASGTRQPGLNSFAQLPGRREATPRSAETAQAEIASSRPLDGIADRFPTTAGFVSALLAGSPGASNDAPDSTVIPVSDTIPATRGTSIDAPAGGVDMQFVVSLFLALILSGLVVWVWLRGRTPSAIR
jgi:hypothetical protein